MATSEIRGFASNSKLKFNTIEGEIKQATLLGSKVVYQNYLGARLSNSSKNIIVGLTPDPLPEFFLEAFSKTFRTDASLSPMYFDNNSGP